MTTEDFAKVEEAIKGLGFELYRSWFSPEFVERTFVHSSDRGPFLFVVIQQRQNLRDFPTE